MKNKCDMTAMISALIDGELAAKDTEFAQRHLQGCGICREEYDALKSLDHLLHEIRPVEASDSFAREFWKKADALDNRKARWLFFQNWLQGWRPAMGAAAALLLIASGVLLFKRTTPPAFDPTVMRIAENVALYSDYEVISNLELFENWEEITTKEDVLN